MSAFVQTCRQGLYAGKEYISVNGPIAKRRRLAPQWRLLKMACQAHGRKGANQWALHRHPAL
jgi:hypothetical protein